MLNSAAVEQTHFKGGCCLKHTRILCVFALLNAGMITQLEQNEGKLEQSSDLIRMTSYPHLKCSNGSLETPGKSYNSFYDLIG